ncbi:uncharacterized protein LOC115435033 isoform X2 [Sphaeramia orbicularis]|uniref:uncharacterized protein LOC115435033 isoform X1 n=1 Tax=Sphaeramia orbicularis TaxID=375764 RepID=UPI0011800166|nr:uncharacterized protein LOC115435033 isoform X1 [Sphaeramia orbicularis]XP_030013065.1 uncharacterized protein LOC115435033 isoform X2 [Sphaeramia orbicularis]
MDLLLGVPLKVIAATFTLNLAAAKAVQVISVTWYPQALALADITGLDGLSSFLACFGLGLAFLTVACGIAFGSGVTAAAMTRQPWPLLQTVCTGLSVCIGCGLAGAFIGLISITLMTLGVRGLFVTGFILSLSLLVICQKQRNNPQMTAARIVVLLVVTFMTIHLTVYFGHNFDNLVVFTLFPAVYLMYFLADKVALRNPSRYIILSFTLLIPLTGIIVGIGISKYSLRYPILIEAVGAVQSVVYTVEMFIGLTGVIIGALTAKSWEEEAIRGLPLLICGPAAVILSNIDENSQHFSLHSLFQEFLGAGGELGLISGFAGASGISLGLTVGAMQTDYPPVIVVIQGGVVAIVLKSILPSFNVIMLVICPLVLWIKSMMQDTQVRDYRDKVTVLQEAVLNSVVLGEVMMGATLVGVAGLLTVALGSAGSYGVVIALLVASGQAYTVSKEI